MPDIGTLGRIVGIVVEHDQVRRFRVARRKRVNGKLAEPAPEPLLVLGRDVLIAEYDHLMLDERGLDPASEEGRQAILQKARVPGPERLLYVADALRAGKTVDELFELTGIDPWFLAQMADLVATEAQVRECAGEPDAASLRRWKRKGFSDARLARLLGSSETAVRALRDRHGVLPVYKRVDSCAAEFPAATAYMYSTYEEVCESEPSRRDKIMILGGGPNRIGQGIEFDYCCVHAALALREAGYETIMVNCNPETVSTDYDTADRLYFEPLTLEDVHEIIRIEQPKGVIVQFGGQTPLKLARELLAAGAPIIGTSPDAIDRAEDRDRFQQLVRKLGLRQPDNRMANSVEQAVVAASEVGYPLVVRPSYVLGGRAMEIVHDEDGLRRYMATATHVSPSSPVLLDRFLSDALEVDVDAVCDGERVLVGAVMEHIEQAGVHSGDSACSLPPFSLAEPTVEELHRQTAALARELGVIGLMNIQFAIKGEDVYLLEVNPRASRTVPFVSKAIARPLAKVAALCMAGIDLERQGMTEPVVPHYYAVKEAVFPFAKFLGVDVLLGPEMRSTGEVMGIGQSFGEAYAKAQVGAGNPLPAGGTAFLSLRDADKTPVLEEVARQLLRFGFELVGTAGTVDYLAARGVECRVVNKVQDGRPHIVDMITNGAIHFVVNTTEGRQAIADSFAIRHAALRYKVPYTTTLAGARATCLALQAERSVSVNCLHDLHRELSSA